MREKANFKSYRDWLKKNMLREQQQRYELLKKRQEMMEREREQDMRKSIEAQIEYKQWQQHKEEEQ